MRTTALHVAFVSAICPWQLHPQQSPPLAFDVASVKRNNSQDFSGMPWAFLRNGYRAHNQSLRTIIATAYNLPIYSDRLAGGPSWIRSERYDIEARVELPNAPSVTVLRAMLQSLLADRFKLVVRRETKMMPVYDVVVARGGVKLTRSKIDEKNCPETGSNIGGTCHSVTGGMGRGIQAQAATISDILAFAENWSDRPLVDKTETQGLFDVQTEGWAPLTPRPVLPGVEPTAEDIAMADPTRPTLFMIFARMGLTLQRQRAPVEAIIIERVERPTEN